MAVLKKQFFCLYLLIGLILPLQYTASCIGSTSSPEPLETLLSPGCNLNCGSYGFISNYNGQCDCICIEFLYYNGVNCVLKSDYPIVADCDECSEMMGPYGDRPMRCVFFSLGNFCVP